MGKRLIYAEDVLELLERDKAYFTDVGMIHAKGAVNSAPTVDPTDVICSHWSDGYEDFNECC